MKLHHEPAPFVFTSEKQIQISDKRLVFAFGNILPRKHTGKNPFRLPLRRGGVREERYADIGEHAPVRRKVIKPPYARLFE